MRGLRRRPPRPPSSRPGPPFVDRLRAGGTRSSTCRHLTCVTRMSGKLLRNGFTWAGASRASAGALLVISHPAATLHGAVILPLNQPI